MTAAGVQAGFLSIGQESARQAVLRAAAVDRLQRTLLVHGPSGAGKGAFVDDLLALLFCTADLAGRPCNACRGCRDARARTHPDLVFGSPEQWREARSTGESIVAVARRWLLEASGAPVAGERRVLIVDGADRANEQTQNVLLKALEEPAPRQMFVLVVDEPTRLLPTIRSRSQPLRIGAVSQRELSEFLVDRQRLPADQAAALARISGGLVGRATSLARDPTLLEWRRRTQQELLELLGRGPADRFGSVRDLLDAAARHAAPDARSEAQEGDVPLAGAAQRAAAMLIVDAWLALARDLLVVAASRPELTAAAELLDADLARAAARLDAPRLLDFIKLLERARDGIRQNAAPKLALEAAMLAWPAVGGP